MIEGKDKLNKMFKLLRNRKLIARQRFSCCGSCASSELGQALKEERNQDKRGAVYYHRQDAERLEYGYVYLGFGGLPDCDDGEASDLAVGRSILECAAEAGLALVWNGSARQRPRIILSSQGLP